MEGMVSSVGILSTSTNSVDVDGMSLVVQVALQVVSILMVAFFSSSEASLISVNKFRVRHLAVIV